MAYVFYNPNPRYKRTGDCVIRAIAKLMDSDWEIIYVRLCVQGLIDCDWGSSNQVWGNFLYNNGFRKAIIPDHCPDCYTIADFCEEHPKGRYLLAIGDHVVAVVDGDYFDTFDSGDEVPIYFWEKRTIE